MFGAGGRPSTMRGTGHGRSTRSETETETETSCVIVRLCEALDTMVKGKLCRLSEVDTSSRPRRPLVNAFELRLLQLRYISYHRYASIDLQLWASKWPKFHQAVLLWRTPRITMPYVVAIRLKRSELSAVHPSAPRRKLRLH